MTPSELRAKLLVLLRQPATIYMAASVLARGAGILLIPLYSRRLSAAEYGDYALGQAMILIASNLLSVGMLAAVPRFYFDSKDPKAAEARSGSVARWFALVTFLGGVVSQLLIFVFASDETTGLLGRWALSCLVWASVGQAVTYVPAQYYRALQRPFKAAAFQLGEFLLVCTMAIIMVVVLDRGLGGAFEALALAYAVTGIVSCSIIFFVVQGRLDTAVLRDALRFSLPFVPHFLANQGQMVADRWVLKLMGLGAGLGAYSVASQITSPVGMISLAWNDAEVPKLGEHYREGGMKKVRAVFRKFARSYVLVSALAGIGVLLLMPIAWFLVGEELRGAFWMVPPLLLIMIIEAVFNPAISVVYYASRTEMIPKITISTGVLNVLLNLGFIAWLGVPGALVARGLSSSYRTIAGFVAAKRCFDADLSDAEPVKVRPQPVAALSKDPSQAVES